MQKRIFSAWMAAVLLLLCLPLSASAEEVDSGPFSVVDAGFAGKNTIHILALGEAFATPTDADYDIASVYYKKNEVPSPLYTTCPIVWDFEQIDSSTPGFYTLDGIVELTEELVPDESLFPDGQVTVPLSYYVYDPADPETKLAIDAVKFHNPTIYNLETGADVRSLQLPATAIGHYSAGELTNGKKCDIAWDYDSFNSSVTGKQTIYGEIVPPEAFRLEETSQAEGKLKVQCEIMVSNPEVPAQEVIIYGQGYKGIYERVIPLGMDTEELAASFEKRLDHSQQFLFLTEAGDVFFSAYEIDTTLIDTTKAGAYFPLVMELPAYTIFDQTVKNMTAVYVIDPGEVDLRCFEYDITTGYLHSSWFYHADAPELWVKIDDGDWQAADSDSYTFLWYATSQTQQLKLNVQKLDSGHSYEFEVRYDTGKYSANTIVVDLSGGMTDIYETPVDGDRHGYDRDDGSDDNTDGDDTDNGDSTPPGNGDIGSSPGGTPGDDDTGNNGTPPGDGNTGGNTGSTPGNGDTGSGESGGTPPTESGGGNPDTIPQTPAPDHSDDKGDAAELPTEDSFDPPAQSVSITVEETKVPAAKKPVLLPEDQPFASAQAGTAEQTQPSEPAHSSPTPEQSTLQSPTVDLAQPEPQPSAEATAARSEPVSSALPIALGVGGLVCTAAFWWLRKRGKP